MSWVILGLTIWIAAIIGVGALLRRSEEPRISFRKRTGTAPPVSNPLPHLTAWWQPVWPITSRELGDRLSRGLKIGLAMAFAVIAFSAIGINDGAWVLAFVVYASIPILGVGCVMSVTHTLILRLLPYRGPIMSTLVGVLVGVVAERVLRDVFSSPIVVLVGVLYGGLIGIVEYVIKSEEITEPPTISGNAR